MRLFLSTTAVTLMLSAVSYADTTYTYTGPDFNEVEAPYTTSSHITGSFTVNDQAPDSPFFGDPSNGGFTTGLVGFSFTDGFTTYTLQNSPQFIITYQLTDGLPDRSAVILSTDPGQYFQSRDHYLSTDEYFEDAACYHGMCGSIANPQGFPGLPYEPGTWTATTTPSSPTPEPSSLILLGTGAAGLITVAKRRLV